MRNFTVLNRWVAAVLIAVSVLGNSAVYGQKSVAKTAAAKTESKAECKGNYTGIVTYTRTVRTQYSGKFGSNYQHNYTFNSNISIRDDGRTNGSMYADSNGIGGSFNFMGKASATLNETTDDLKVTEGDDFCKLSLAGAKDKRHYRCESRFRKESNGSGEGDVNVFLGFRGDKYKISLDNPTVTGTGSQSSNSSCSGTCSPDKPINSSTPPSAFKGKPPGTYTDEMPLNPNNLNRLSGTFTRPNGDETVTITWNLARCAPPMQIDDLRFEHARFPDPSRWVGVDPLTGTTDGNRVKVKAKVFNNTGETGYATVKFSEKASGEQLPDGEVSVAVKAGEARDVEYEWDTSGYAWDENKKPLTAREVRAEIQGGDSVSEKIKILPKPVVMAHGLWSNAAAWAEYPVYMREAHSFAWRGYAVGADPANGKMSTGDHPGNYKPTNTIYQNAQELAKQVKHAREVNNAWHIDIVAHSMGGLISRQYINTFMDTAFDGKPAVTHLVMLGTPNMGSPCADTVNQLFEDFDQNEMHAMRELRPIIVRAFNTRVTEKKGVKFSVLIGAFMPRTCLDESAWGDGVVPLDSAKYNNTDYAYVPRNHIDLTGRDDFDGFVMPRIAIGPKKARAESAVAWVDTRPVDGRSIFQKASFRGMDDDAAPPTGRLTTKQKVDLGSKETKMVEVPVQDGSFAGVVLVAPLAVRATLYDETGIAVGESKAGMDAMRDMFRTIAVKRPIRAAVWKLKLENLGAEPVTVLAGGVSSQTLVSDLTATARKLADESVAVTVKWNAGSSPILGAKITAQLPGGASTDLYDDGKHSDGAGGDGVYGGTLGKLAGDRRFVEISAEADGLIRKAVALVEETKAKTSAPRRAR